MLKLWLLFLIFTLFYADFSSMWTGSHIFVCHGGSGASGTISSIQSLQSGASVDAAPLTLYWTDIENAENFVMNWLN